MYIGIVFRLLKHSDELDIRTPTVLGGTTILLGGTAPCAPRWLRPCLEAWTDREHRREKGLPVNERQRVPTLLHYIGA